MPVLGDTTLGTPPRSNHPKGNPHQDEEAGVNERKGLFTPIVKHNPPDPVLNE